MGLRPFRADFYAASEWIDVEAKYDLEQILKLIFQKLENLSELSDAELGTGSFMTGGPCG